MLGERDRQSVGIPSMIADEVCATMFSYHFIDTFRVSRAVVQAGMRTGLVWKRSFSPMASHGARSSLAFFLHFLLPG